MNTIVNDRLPTVPGGWVLTWGPKVVNGTLDLTTTGPENVWFAAESSSQNPGPPLCVVAIAGTAAYNYKTWLTTDGGVSEVVNFDTPGSEGSWLTSWASGPWATGNPITVPTGGMALLSERAYVARGTCTGVANILNSPSPTGQPGDGQYIHQYLESVVQSKPDYQIIFTGHSMGGAVAPTLAFGLIQSDLVPGLNSMSNPAQVYPSAGPSMGNMTFYNTFTSTFTPGTGSDYTNPNTLFYNAKDVVPQAWAVTPPGTDDLRYLDNIKTIYSFATAETTKIDDYVAAAKDNANSSLVKEYMPIKGVSFEYDSTDLPWPYPNPNTNEELGEDLIIQHTTAYWKKIGISDFITATTTLVNHLYPPKEGDDN